MSEARMDKAEATFHLRPVFVADEEIEEMVLIAATDRLLLFSSEDSKEYFIVRGTLPAANEGMASTVKIPAGKIGQSAKCVRFLDDITICFIDYADHRRMVNQLVLLRATDGTFQHLERKTYSVFGDQFERICNMHIYGGHPVILSINYRMRWILRVWKLQVPQWSSSLQAVQPQLSGEYKLDADAEVNFAHSNGHVLTIRFCLPSRLAPSAYRNVLHDLRTGKTQVISEDIVSRSRFPEDFGKDRAFCPLNGNGALAWDRRKSQLTLNFAQGEDSFSGYASRLWKQMSLTPTCRIVPSPTRFYVALGNIVFSGYAPGADVPLEGVAASLAWRSLSTAAQSSLIEDRACSNRQILIRAMTEEEEKRKKEHQKEERRLKNLERRNIMQTAEKNGMSPSKKHRKRR